MPSRFCSVGSVRAMQHPVVGEVRPGAPHLLAGDDPLVAVARRARVASDARSEPAPGSEKSWHHTSSLRHDRREEAGLLLVGAPGQDRGPGEVEAEDVEPAEVVRRELASTARASRLSSAEAAVLTRPHRGDEPDARERGVPGLVVGPGTDLAQLGARRRAPRLPATPTGSRWLGPLLHDRDRLGLGRVGRDRQRLEARRSGSRRLAPLSLRGRLACDEVAAQHLADVVARQLVDHHEPRRHRVRRQPVAASLRERVGIERRARSEHNPRPRHLADPPIGNPGDAHVGDGRILRSTSSTSPG